MELKPQTLSFKAQKRTADYRKTIMERSLAIVIVTYNRCDDLKITLSAIASMAEDFDYLVIVDNASTDNTQALLASPPEELSEKLRPVTMPSNSGGAGGFHAGIKHAMNLGADWIWSSDDDAVPQQDCFKVIRQQTRDPMIAYGSVAIEKGSETEDLCWPAPRAEQQSGPKQNLMSRRSDMRETEIVQTLPFLGLMVSSDLVKIIGLPNKSYFISGDDFEYCIRIKKAGAKLVLLRDSVLQHPAIPRYIIDLKIWKIYCLAIPPWRRVLDCRNRLWNSRLEKGIPWATLTTISLLARMCAALIKEQDKLGQLKATCTGIWKGWTEYAYSREPEHVGLK